MTFWKRQNYRDSKKFSGCPRAVRKRVHRQNTESWGAGRILFVIL